MGARGIAGAHHEQHPTDASSTLTGSEVQDSVWEFELKLDEMHVQSHGL